MEIYDEKRIDILDRSNVAYSSIVFFLRSSYLLCFQIFPRWKKKYNRGKNIIATRKRENDENDRRIFFRIAGRNDRNDYLGGKKAKRKRGGKWRAKRWRTRVKKEEPKYIGDSKGEREKPELTLRRE